MLTRSQAQHASAVFLALCYCRVQTRPGPDPLTLLVALEGNEPPQFSAFFPYWYQREGTVASEDAVRTVRDVCVLFVCVCICARCVCVCVCVACVDVCVCVMPAVCGLCVSDCVHVCVCLNPAQVTARHTRLIGELTPKVVEALSRPEPAAPAPVEAKKGAFHTHTHTHTVVAANTHNTHTHTHTHAHTSSTHIREHSPLSLSLSLSRTHTHAPCPLTHFDSAAPLSRPILPGQRPSAPQPKSAAIMAAAAALQPQLMASRLSAQGGGTETGTP